MEKDVAIPQRPWDAGMVQYHGTRCPKGFRYLCHQCGMEDVAYESEELSLYSLRSLDASVLLGALTGALLPSEDIFCHSQAAAKLSLVTRGQGRGTP